MIYLDNNAYTFIDPFVKSEIDDFLTKPFGNPSSTHRLGQFSKAMLLESQKKIAQFLGVHFDELVFTSGATEALNMLISSIRHGHVISSNLEHPAVLQPLKRCEAMGVKVTYIEGLVTLEKIKKAMTPETTHLVFMAVNNETGIKTDIDEISDFALEMGLELIVDGVALLGKELFKIPKGLSAICFSGHKIHGPMGIGLAYIRKGVKINPFILGGEQQKKRRGGTENVAAIVGLASAISLLKKCLPQATDQMEKLRDYFEKELVKIAPSIIIHGQNQKRVCNVSNVAFSGFDGELLMMKLDQMNVAVSLGAACSTGGLEPSHVLLGMGLPMKEVNSSLRFSLSRHTTKEEIDQTLDILSTILKSGF